MPSPSCAILPGSPLTVRWSRIAWICQPVLIPQLMSAQSRAAAILPIAMIRLVGAAARAIFTSTVSMVSGVPPVRIVEPSTSGSNVHNCCRCSLGTSMIPETAVPGSPTASTVPSVALADMPAAQAAMSSGAGRGGNTICRVCPSNDDFSITSSAPAAGSFTAPAFSRVAATMLSTLTP